MKWLRQFNRIFRGFTPRPEKGLFERHTRAFDAARVLVRVHHALLLFWACSSVENWTALMERRNIVLLWPVSWVRLVGEPAGWHIVLFLYLFGTLFGALFSDRRAARIVAFVAIFQHAALVNSLGKIYHHLHAMVLMTFVLIFLPDIRGGAKERGTRAQRHLYTTVFWTAQALMMLTYSMSGLGKVIFGVWQMVKGEVGALQPQGLAIHLADNMIERRIDTVMGSWLIDHALLAWPFMLLTVYIQLFSIVAVCRPSLHRWWGLGLFAFHIGTGLFMSILTATNALLLGVFMLASPFDMPGDWAIRDSLRSLPLFGWLFRRAERQSTEGAPRPTGAAG